MPKWTRSFVKGSYSSEPKCKLNGAKCKRRYGILAGHFGLRGPKSSKFFFGSKIHNEHNQTFSKISVKLQQISWKAVRKLNVPKHESVKNNKTMFLDQYNFFTN